MNNNLLAGTEWWKRTVIYSAYVEQFAGNFPAMAEKLDYLSRLGVGCLHLLPFYPSPFIDDGYDISDYCGIRPELGTLQDFKHFTEEAHRRGIQVMIDLVLNHTSTQHPWFLSAASSPESPKRDFYLWSKTGSEYAEAVNVFSGLKPTNWIASIGTDWQYFSTFYPEQADLNWNNPAAFDAMMGVVDFWVGMGVDGFRLDAAAHLIKKDGTNSVGLSETHAVIKRIRAYVDKHYPGVALLGEAYGGDPVASLKTYFGESDECHLIYHFPLVRASFLALARGDRSVMDAMLEESAGIPANTQWATLLRHHDEIPLRGLTAEEEAEVFERFDPEKKYQFNLGTSLRLGTMFKGEKKDILHAFELLFSVPGSPIIYYGDEIGMENQPMLPGERDTRRAVRGKFDWEEAGKEMEDPGSLFNGVAQIVRDWKGRQVSDTFSAGIAATP